MFELMLLMAKEFIQLRIHVMVAVAVMRITCAMIAMPAYRMTMPIPVTTRIMVVIVMTAMSIMTAVT